MADYDDPDTEKGSETMPCEDQDAAFILGKGGSTKQKIARVSEAELELDEKANVLTIYGTHRQRKKARDYVQFIIQQRQGNVQPLPFMIRPCIGDVFRDFESAPIQGWPLLA